MEKVIWTCSDTTIIEDNSQLIEVLERIEFEIQCVKEGISNIATLEDKIKEIKDSLN